MTKKKLIGLIAAAVCLMYAISLLGAFFLCTELDRRQFDKSMRLIRENHKKNITLFDDLFFKNPTKQFQTHFAPVVTEMFSAAHYPLMYVLADAEGNIISRSDSIIQMDVETTDGETVPIVIALNEYIGEEAARAISDYTKNADEEKMFLDVEQISVCEKNGEWLPVEMTLRIRDIEGDAESFPDAEEALTVRLTDNEATYTAKRSDGVFFYSWLFFKDKYYINRWNRLYGELEKKLSAALAEGRSLQDVAAGFNETSRDTLKIANTIHTGDGKIYSVFLLSRRDGLQSLIAGDFFLPSVLYLTITAVLFGAAAEFAAIKMYHRNKRAERSRIAFTAAAAHELKTPLAAIAGDCECVLERVSPQEDLEHVLSIYDESKRMSHLVKTLLQFNQLQTGEKLKKRPASLRSLSETEADKYKSILDAKNIDFTIKGVDATVLCDPELLGLVIDNFLSNAAKFTPTGGIVRIIIEDRNKKARFEIRNTGSRIDETDAPHIWEELYSADRARNRTDRSSGMGLAVSRVILERHGFPYGFENTGSGVCFYFESRVLKLQKPLFATIDIPLNPNII
ncbi:MAG: HAMP domain-containing histidine kinase [Clostridia bacterium]|nr:HAMP domain-containing histidine kinase [Clostridia bacterium]